MSAFEIILTSDKRMLTLGEKFVHITQVSIKKYNNNQNVIALVCSRNIAIAAQNISLPNLQLIQLTSAGIDDIDTNYCKSKSIVVCNAAGIYSVAMAEFVIYMMLMSAKRYNRQIKKRSIRLQRNYKFITELSDKTIGIMGVGSIGFEIAKRAQSFDMQVIGYADKTTEKQYFDKIYHKEEIDKFITLCDYLVITLPHTKETEGMINYSVFTKMKTHITIVNVGRSSVFNEADFLSALKKNKSMTALLDMYELIPNAISNPFRRLSNVKVIPGVTAVSCEINDKLKSLVSYNISCLETKSHFKNIVN